jgi:hypothetical protein
MSRSMGPRVQHAAMLSNLQVATSIQLVGLWFRRALHMSDSSPTFSCRAVISSLSAAPALIATHSMIAQTTEAKSSVDLMITFARSQF